MIELAKSERSRVSLQAPGVAVCLVALVVIDALIRPALPPSIDLVLPALEMAAAIGLSWQFVFKSLVIARPDYDVCSSALSDDVYEAAARCNTCRAAIASAFVKRDAAISRATDELKQYPRFTYILHEQMDSVAARTEKATKAILSNLGNVDGRITALLDFIKESQSNDSIGNLTERIESQMTSCRDTLERLGIQQQQQIEAGSRQRARIGAETDDVLGVVERVNGIARQTLMLSFNVSIEAARAGEASKGFSVIALEIRKLASEVQILSSDMHVRVERLMRSVTVDFEEFEKQRELAEHEAIANVIRVLNELSSSQSQLTMHERKILQKVGDESASIAAPIMDAMGSVQFQDIIRQQLGQLKLMSDAVGEQFESVGAMLVSPDAEMDETTLSERLDEMFSGYVMADQRETHVASWGKQLQKEPIAEIELF